MVSWWDEECSVGSHAGEVGRGLSLLAPCIRIGSALVYGTCFSSRDSSQGVSAEPCASRVSKTIMPQALRTSAGTNELGSRGHSWVLNAAVVLVVRIAFWKSPSGGRMEND